MTKRKSCSLLLAVVLFLACAVPAMAAGSGDYETDFEALLAGIHEGTRISDTDPKPAVSPEAVRSSVEYTWIDYVYHFANSADELIFTEQPDMTWRELVYECNIRGYYLFAFLANGKQMGMEDYDKPICAGQHFLLTDPDIQKVYALVDVVAAGSGTQDPQPSPAPTAAVTPAPAAAPEPTAAPAVSSAISSLQQEGIDLVNALRAESGIAPLQGNAEACAAAQIRANEMARTGYFSHTRPDGSECFTVFRAPYPVGENIAMNSAPGISAAAVLHNQWVNSPGHLRNMRNEGYRQIGIAYAQAGNGAWYGCQLFCGSGPVTVNGEPEPGPALTPAPSQTSAPAPTPTPTPTPTPAPTPTPTPTPTPAPTPTRTAAPTSSPTPTATLTPAPTSGPTGDSAATPAPSPTIGSWVPALDVSWYCAPGETLASGSEIRIVVQCNVAAIRFRIHGESADGASLELEDKEYVLIGENDINPSLQIKAKVSGPAGSTLVVTVDGTYTDGEEEWPFEVTLGTVTIKTGPDVTVSPEGAGYVLTQLDGDTVLIAPGIGPGSAFVTVREALSRLNCPPDTHLAVIAADGKQVAESMPLATGMVIRLLGTDGVTLGEITVIVPGDVCGTGKMSIVQLTAMARALTNTKPLDGPYLTAGDWNANGKIDLIDLVHEARLLTAP